MTLADDCQVARLPILNGRNYWIGVSVARAPDMVAVAVPGDFSASRGAVYIVTRQGLEWSNLVQVGTADAVPGDNFGLSVALDGQTLVAGAPRTYNLGIIDGAAYVFERDATGEWTQVARLIGSRPDVDPGNAEHFGEALAIQGDTLLIGAYGGSEAYVFQRDEQGGWSERQRLAPWNGGWYFGYSVALDGDMAVVGALNDSEITSYNGAAYVFQRSVEHDWVPVVKLLPVRARPLEGFGCSVAAGGGTIMVGSELGRVGSVVTGLVSVFGQSAEGEWVLRQRLTPPTPSFRFGSSIDIEGDLALVGAERYGGSQGYGAAFLYQRRADGLWTLVDALSASDGLDGDYFGYSVALSGNLAVIGAPFRDEDGVEDSGAAYVFAVSPDLNGNGWMDACECPGDVNHDWTVGGTDLAVLLAHFGAADLPDDPDCRNLWPTRCAGDLDGDADVDLADLAILLANFGATCPEL